MSKTLVNGATPKFRLPFARRGIAIVAGLALLTGCGTYVPEGATVIAVKGSNQEFDRGEIRATSSDFDKMGTIRMRWYDTNTFLTTATLSPGVYSFRARNYAGGGISREITITPDKHLYEIKTGGNHADKDVAPVKEGAPVRAQVGLPPGTSRPARISVLFIGKEIILRTTPLQNNNAIEVKAPYAGPWRIQLHVPGAVPLSYVHQTTNVQGPLDLGTVVLK